MLLGNCYDGSLASDSFAPGHPNAVVFADNLVGTGLFCDDVKVGLVAAFRSLGLGHLVGADLWVLLHGLSLGLGGLGLRHFHLGWMVRLLWWFLMGKIC